MSQSDAGSAVGGTLSMEAVSQYFVRLRGSHQIRLTRAGKERFREDFAKAGFRVEEIKTVNQFFVAHNAWLTHYFHAVVTDKDTDPVIKDLLTR